MKGDKEEIIRGLTDALETHHDSVAEVYLWTPEDTIIHNGIRDAIEYLKQKEI